MDEIYSVPDVGTVVGGTLYRSVLVMCVWVKCDVVVIGCECVCVCVCVYVCVSL